MLAGQDLTQTQVCRDLSIGRFAIARWVKHYQSELNGGRRLGNPLTSEQQRIRMLEIENCQLREDNILLKKASALA